MFVCDEFQQLAVLREHSALEAAVRHAAERARHVAFIFAGSERHLLADMFENPDRPLYRLCDRMTLDRISREDYAMYFGEVGRARWRKTVSEKTIERILQHTLRHPYYVNALCGRLWSARHPPTAPAVDAAWKRYVDEDKRRVVTRVLELSPTQRAVLAAICREPTPHLTGQAFLRTLRLATSTGMKAKAVLEREDLIQQNEAGVWEPVDPVMASVLSDL